MGDPVDGRLDFGTQDFTAEAWVRATANDERVILGKRAYGTPAPPYWQVTVTDDSSHQGHIRVNVFDGVVTPQVYGPNIRVDDGLWHHVVVAFDRDAGIVVYVDGVSAGTDGTDHRRRLEQRRARARQGAWLPGIQGRPRRGRDLSVPAFAAPRRPPITQRLTPDSQAWASGWGVDRPNGLLNRPPLSANTRCQLGGGEQFCGNHRAASLRLAT